MGRFGSPGNLWRQPKDGTWSHRDSKFCLRFRRFAGGFCGSRVEHKPRAESGRDGRCHRFVYDTHGKPDRCSEPTTRTGWLYLAHERKWYPVDSCERHVDQLEARPHPPRRSTVR
jgi:hypothetical protein